MLMQLSWTEIDCKYSHVPKGAPLKAITDFLGEHYPDALVKEVERNRNGYELKLDNRIELNFDLAGRFRGYDD